MRSIAQGDESQRVPQATEVPPLCRTWTGFACQDVGAASPDWIRT